MDDWLRCWTVLQVSFSWRGRETHQSRALRFQVAPWLPLMRSNQKTETETVAGRSGASIHPAQSSARLARKHRPQQNPHCPFLEALMGSNCRAVQPDHVRRKQRARVARHCRGLKPRLPIRRPCRRRSNHNDESLSPMPIARKREASIDNDRFTRWCSRTSGNATKVSVLEPSP